jgi:hypothetical protein
MTKSQALAIQGLLLILFEHALIDPRVVYRSQRRWGQGAPHLKLPSFVWPTILHQVEQGESFCHNGREYGISYKAVRRMICVARRC